MLGVVGARFPIWSIGDFTTGGAEGAALQGKPPADRMIQADPGADPVLTRR